jgi:C1A family cysteine protease
MPAKNPRNGISLTAATQALAVQGQPLEADCPYAAVLPIGWRPTTNAATFTADATIHANSIASVRALLDANMPAVLIFRPSEAFYYVDTAGRLPSRPSDLDISSRHAVVAVGYGTVGGRFYQLVRNSWGAGWGDRGHAWLSEEYLAPRLISVTSISAKR